MTTPKILTRADLPDSDKWDLIHLFSGPDKWAEEFAWIQQTYPKLTEWKGHLGESAGTLAFSAYRLLHTNYCPLRRDGRTDGP